jgi:hypothetical protein
MILALVMGAAGGVISGMLGVGGGILFVPALTLVLSLSQVKAEATSLLAIIPVALVGAVRQNRYGNVRVRDGAVLGGLSAVGVLAGVALANELTQRALRIGFAVLLTVVAAQFLRRYWQVRRRQRDVQS